MKNEDRWTRNFQEVMQFMQTTHCRPSKHRLEEHQMLNWIKFNKKRLALGKMPSHRQKRFAELLRLADECLRVNQYA